MNELRIELIANYVNEKLYASLNEICDTFHISPATARRDLTILERSGQLVRTHGGAKCINSNIKSHELDLLEHRENIEIDEKILIASKACEFIEENDCILLGFDSTTCRSIAENIAKKDIKLTVITGDLKIIEILSVAKNIDIIVIGGNLRKSGKFTYGPLAEQYFKGLYANKCFLGFDSIEAERGITMRTNYSLRVAQLEISCSSECFLVGGPSKFSMNSLYQVAPISSISHIITCTLPKDVMSKFEKYKDKFIFADK